MKILLVSKTPTHPTSAGNRNFIYNQAELFRKLGHHVCFLFIEEKGISDKRWDLHEEVDAMKPYWGSDLFVYKVGYVQKVLFNIKQKFINRFMNKGYPKVDDQYPYGLTSFVKNINAAEKFDCCVINYWFLSKLFKEIKFPLEAINTHDYFSYKDLLVGKNAVDTALDAHDEAVALQRCPHIFALNTEEAIFFSKMSPQSKIYNVFSRYIYKSSAIVGNKEILFLSANHKFNYNGLIWFLDRIFPLIIGKFPDVVLKIGGSICNAIPNKYKTKNVRLLGYIDNVDSFYNSADIVINPTYQGTGLKIKTFEGISYDKVVMAHPHSMVGVYNPENAPIFASINAMEWVDYLSKVWSNSAFIKEIKGKNDFYLHEMQEYIESQYLSFFSCIENKADCKNV